MSTDMADETSVRHLPGRRGGRVFLIGSVVGQACALLRYTVLARMLGPEQLGLVATLILISNFFEMISDTGSDRFLVQDRDGDKPEAQRLVQLVVLCRGAFMALGLALVAWPIAAYFNEPALFAGIAILGLSPLIGGLMHLDTKRFQRTNDFRAEGWAMILSETLGLIATMIAAFATRDFTAVLYGLITRSLVQVTASHILAKRSYGFQYNREISRRLGAFAAPLLANGLLLFLAGQSDRLMISGMVGLEALGHYTAVMLLALYPTVALIKFMQGIHLPMVAADPNASGPDSAADLLAGRATLLALGVAVGFAALGPAAVMVLYGVKFELPIWLVALIGILQALRFARVWPTTMALGLGKSRIVMSNSLARMSGIPVAFVGLAFFDGVPAIVGGFIFGEIMALLAGVLMLNRARSHPWTRDMDRVGALIVGSALILGATISAEHQYTWGLAFIPLILLSGGWMMQRERAALAQGFKMLKSLRGKLDVRKK